MRRPKENPLNVDGLAAETNQGADDAAALPGRLDRYSKAHHRAVEMAHYAREKCDVKLAGRLQNCGSYLLFRDYYRVSKVRLHAAQFCKAHLLCPLCAIRRGAKLVQSYMQRLAVIMQEQPDLKPYMVTLTVKDGDDLSERFQHLQSSLKFLHRTRSRDRQYSEACKASGAVWSYEFKRGKGSQRWHPHVHAVWLCREKPDAKALSEQWRKITGDSFIVDVRPFHSDEDAITGFLEVFKYAVKFSDLPLEDNWHGYEVLRGKRLIASFGDFRGVEVPDDLTDERLDDEPYVELLFQFLQGAGYSFVNSHRQVADPTTAADRKKALRRPQVQPVLLTAKEAHLRLLQRKYGAG